MTAGQQPPGTTPFGVFLQSLLVPALALKRRLRDTLWAVRGRGLRNPPLPERPRSVMFVCLGNICRSPFAEHLAARLFEEAGLADVRCSSAGFRTSQAARSPAEAVDVAREFGVSLEGHRPVLLTPELMATHDMVVAMEPSQIETLQRRWPTYRTRFFLLPLFEVDAGVGPFERCHLVDPYGRDDEEFRRCYRRIDAALRHMIACWRRQR